MTNRGESSILRPMIEIPDAVIAQMQDQAFAGYPGECCGLLFAKPGSGKVTRCAPLENIADRFHALDPAEYPRTSRDAFMINELKLTRAVKEAEASGEQWLVFYHSHIDCGAYFSAEDRKFAAPNNEPIYPEIYQMVIETHADRIVEARVFRWDGKDFAHEQTFPEFARKR
jgi:[CysO sulfur-carrier protein]-S-L-cysteine hydrolase